MAANERTGLTLIVTTPAGAGRDATCEPITVGVPFPRGRITDARRIGCMDAAGADVPVQALPSEWWPDGSIRWALLDFQATGAVTQDRHYQLHFDRDAFANCPARLNVVEGAERIVVDTGAARFSMRCGERFPFAAAVVGGVDAIDSASTCFTVTDEAGKVWRAVVTKVAVEQRGALRTSVRLDATIGPRRRPLLQVVARLQFFAGSAATRVALTVRNPRRARHRGGFWELGDEGSVFVRDASLNVAVPAAIAHVTCAPDAAAPEERFSAPFEIYQDSSGGENWQHRTHVNRLDRVACSFRGYRLRAGNTRRLGLRATPAVTASHAAGTASVAVEHFWQNFPMAIEADGAELVVRVWPRQFADLHEIQGGEQKTHRFVLAFGADAMARDAVHWGRTPALASAAPEWYAAADAVPYLSPASADVDPRYRMLVDAAIEGKDSFAIKTESIDEYGWRNFGDLYADHENAFSGTAEPIVSHYNNQYDAVHGFAAQFMRTGDARWWGLMTALATHVTDIDIYHTDRDKAAFNHGLFWHTFHYVPADRCSHRSYPKRDGVCGGGPANEHNYVSGLRMHWLLTGDPQSREAAIGLANWVIDMDNGRKTVLRWLAPSHTGLASATHSPDYHGPGRGAGHSIMALLEGHRLTDDRRFLDKAEQLIRRAVHPDEDIAALDLLDAERRWSYTVFLQALGRYLHHKIELGEVDGTYAYARAALLHYARWMAQHEYPFLDKPAILEYPTETWAAQDIRKSDVFSFAAECAAGEERAGFLERARFFFDYTMATLIQTETRTLARPLVLLLSNGLMQLGGRPVVDCPEPPAAIASTFAARPRFLPQKAIARQRLTVATAAAAAVALLATIACLAGG